MIRITINVSDQLAREVKHEADQQGVSVSALMAASVQHYLGVCQKKVSGKRVLELANMDKYQHLTQALSEMRRGYDCRV